ncbi:unnamed protein product [Wuchereria bancrofti]|uniref:Uncharacterized protein n=1 Tax=Wuchereria bancrofti TaxID=6293 RepID=A0A3P7DSR6_WUCBA|nr:unnamed protein product [Wuchereria bancrofti]
MKMKQEGMFFSMFFITLFIISDQLSSVESVNKNDHHMMVKRLQSLALLRGNRLYGDKNLKNYHENKGKGGQYWFNNSPWNTLNSGKYYIPYCLIISSL